MFMVLILDGRKIGLFGFKNIQFVTALELIKSLIQVKQKRLLLTCALIYAHV